MVKLDELLINYTHRTIKRSIISDSNINRKQEAIQHNRILAQKMEQDPRLDNLMVHKEPMHNLLVTQVPLHNRLVRQIQLHNLGIQQEARQAMGMEVVEREVWTARIRSIVLQKNTG